MLSAILAWPLVLLFFEIRCILSAGSSVSEYPILFVPPTILTHLLPKMNYRVAAVALPSLSRVWYHQSLLVKGDLELIQEVTRSIFILERNLGVFILMVLMVVLFNYSPCCFLI